VFGTHYCEHYTRDCGIYEKRGPFIGVCSTVLKQGCDPDNMIKEVNGWLQTGQPHGIILVDLSLIKMEINRGNP